jgi:rhodanese-related sulfurtransferase
MATMRISPGLVAATALAALGACADRGSEPFSEVSIEEVERMLGQPDVLVVDANTDEVFRRRHLPGARHWKSAAPPQVLPAEKDRPIVFYCASPS